MQSLSLLRLRRARVHCARRLVLLVFLVLATACGGGEELEPFFDVAAVQGTWPEVRDCRFSIEHDAVNIIVYAAPEAEAAYTEGSYPFAEGTVIVKAEHDDSACTELIEYTAMRKLAPGASPEAGDWEWQRVDASGEVIESGALLRCAGCHQSCTDRDFACTDP